MGTETSSQNRNESSVGRQTREVHASYNASLTDDVILVSGAVAPVGIGLPAKTSVVWPPGAPSPNPAIGAVRGFTVAANLGCEIDVEDVDGAQVITITPADAQINGAASFVVPALARVKCTFSPSTGAWTAQAYTASGGGGALAGDAVGPPATNRVQQIRGDAINAIAQLVSGASIKQTQGGTLLVPATEEPIVFQVRDPARAAWIHTQGASTFNGVIDNYYGIGYNPNGGVVAEPSAGMSWEVHYAPSPGADHTEWYVSFNRAGGLNGTRPFSVIYNNLTGDSLPGITYEGNQAIYLQKGAALFAHISDGGISFDTAAQAVVAIAAPDTLALQALNAISQTSKAISVLATQAGAGCQYSGDYQYWFGRTTGSGIILDYRNGNTKVNLSCNDLFADLGTDTLSFVGANQMRWKSVRAATGVFGLGVAGNVDRAGGVGIIALGAATTNPSVTPASAAAIYSDSATYGVKVKDALGAVSNISGGFLNVVLLGGPQTVSAANSISKYYSVSGGIVAPTALTISLPPDIGTMIIVRNYCLFGVTITFTSGAASAAIPAGSSAIVCGTGTDAVLFGCWTNTA